MKAQTQRRVFAAKALFVARGVKTVYSRYVAVSVLHAEDTVELSKISKRPLIAQPMPLLSAHDVVQLGNHPSLMPASYVAILGDLRMKAGGLRPHQLLFLLHVALSTGSPRTMSKWLEEHMTDFIPEDVPPDAGLVKSDAVVEQRWKGKCFHPDRRVLETLFWIVVDPEATHNGDHGGDVCLRC